MARGHNSKPEIQSKRKKDKHALLQISKITFILNLHFKF